MSESDPISKTLLELVCCPVGKQPLELRDEKLVCNSCGLTFPIRDGIPVLLVEEAELPEGISSLQEVQCDGQQAASSVQ